MSNSTKYFCNSRDFRVDNLTVINASSSRLDEGFKLLHDNIAIDAAHNSEDRCDAPSCYPETRKAVQAEIFSWIGHGDEDDEPKKILWLSGPAGAGKTAIAGSLADTCDEEGLLAGSYFFASFTGSEKRRSKRYLVATLVYHLILPLDEQHPLRRAILSAVLRDPSIFRRRLKDQFRVLLVKPFRDTHHDLDPSHLPKVFIIDGLDEVEAAESRQIDQHEARLANEKNQEEILTALSYAVKDDTLPFRIIVASRPERVIASFFSAQAREITRTVFLDEKYDPDSDIARFLNAEFAMTRRRYKLSFSWPPKEAIRQLVNKSSGQFIYAATVVRFLQSTKQPNPRALLAILLDWNSQNSASTALAPLHALYTRIFMSSADPPTAARWIGVISLLRKSESASFYRQLLQEFEGQADHLFENLTSLVWVPPVEDNSSPYRLHHKSLVDVFLTDTRNQDIAIAYRSGFDFLSARCSAVLRAKTPSVPIDESQLPQFMQHFMDIIVRCWYPIEYEDEHPALLLECDVVWWIHKAVTTLISGDFLLSAERFIIKIFSKTHAMCPPDNPRRCLPQCRHWRSNILRACKAWGMTIPNEVDLLGEAMGHVAMVSHRHISRHFKPTSNGAGSNTADALVPIVTSYTDDEDYKTMLDAVSKMFLRLPAGWIAKCKEETRNGITTSDNVFDSFIQKLEFDLDISSDTNS